MIGAAHRQPVEGGLPPLIGLEALTLSHASEQR